MALSFYKKMFFVSPMSIDEIQAKLILITERADKNYIDFSKINSYECIMNKSSFIISKGPSSLTIGKMSLIPVFLGTLSKNNEGGTNIEVVVRLNYLGGAIGFFVFLFILLMSFSSYSRGEIWKSFIPLSFSLYIFFGTAIQLNKSVISFKHFFVKNLTVFESR